MRPRLRLLTAAFAVLAACQQSPTGAAGYRPGEAATVDHALCLLGFTGVALQTLATGHHTVDVLLNGRPATFVVDTGANITVLNAGFAKEFDAGPATSFPGRALGAGGAMQAQLVGIRELRIGGLPIRTKRIAAADLSQVSNILRPIAGKTIHGIIGQDVLREHRAMLDVAGARLYLIAADQEPAPVPAGRCAAAAKPPRR